MNLRFYLNPETGEPHVLDHGVTEHEVWEVMTGVHERTAAESGSLIVVGQTAAGRWLKIIVVVDSAPNSYFVVTAYPPRPPAIRAIRRRRKNR